MWARCNWRVRAAHMRSRGLCRFQIFRSPTCGPSNVRSRQTWPALTFHAWPSNTGFSSKTLYHSNYNVFGSFILSANLFVLECQTFQSDYGWWDWPLVSRKIPDLHPSNLLPGGRMSTGRIFVFPLRTQKLPLPNVFNFKKIIFVIFNWSCWVGCSTIMQGLELQCQSSMYTAKEI